MLLFQRKGEGECSSPLHAGPRRPGLYMVSPGAMAPMATRGCRSPPFDLLSPEGTSGKPRGEEKARL